jgi:hypothetical protein
MSERIREYYPVRFDHENTTHHVTLSTPQAEFEIVKAAFEHRRQAEHNRVVELFPEPLDQARMQRVRQFFDRLDLTPSSAVDIPPHPTQPQAEALWQITDDVYHDPDDLIASIRPTAGVYSSEHDIVLTYGYRDRDYDTENNLITEIALVHELVHSTGRSAFLLDGEQYTPVRDGFRVFGRQEPRNRGNWLEEAFAHMIAHAYRAQFAPWDSGGDLPFENLIIPAKYTYQNDNYMRVRRRPDSSVFAALGLELLIAKDPSLFDYAIASRTDLEALRQTARRVDQLAPGIYNYLSCLQYTPKDFQQGMDTILTTLHGGDATAIHSADGIVQTALQKYL